MVTVAFLEGIQFTVNLIYLHQYSSWFISINSPIQKSQWIPINGKWQIFKNKIYNRMQFRWLIRLFRVQFLIFPVELFQSLGITTASCIIYRWSRILARWLSESVWHQVASARGDQSGREDSRKVREDQNQRDMAMRGF